MSRKCGCNKNCGCNNMQMYDDFLDIFENEDRYTGPYTWNGYVWYEVEVEYNGPFFGSNRRPEPRNNDCGCRRAERRNNDCGCGR